MQNTTREADLLSAIGSTPLVSLPLPSQGKILAKLEYLNPGGSIKDRTALYMIEAAEQRGELKSGGTIVEASSGNQGIALAMIGAAKGYKVIITVSEKVSSEKQKTLRAYGAKVVVCPATEDAHDPENYHEQAIRIQKQTPNSFMPNQYYNAANPEAHYRTLGPEIWQQTNGKITHFVAAAGTGGTVSGVGRYLKEQNPAIRVIGVDAATSWRSTNGHPKPYKMEGIGVDFETPCLDRSVVDEFIAVTDNQAIDTLKTLASKYGLLVGVSSGAIGYAAIHYASQLTKDNTLVMVFPDSGRAYLSKNYY